MSWFHQEWGNEIERFLAGNTAPGNRRRECVERTAGCFDAMPPAERDALLRWYGCLEAMGPHECGDARLFVLKEMVCHSALSAQTQANERNEAPLRLARHLGGIQ